MILKQSSRKKKPEKRFRYEWSRNYASCRACGTTDISHFMNGFCEDCGRKTISGEARENKILAHNGKCDLCGITREESYRKYGRDFYLSRIKDSVLCKHCHQIKTGSNLGKITKNKWKKFYK